MGLGWILILVFVVVVVWLLATRFNGRGGGGGGSRPESPEDALKRRYAKGEIDRESYERMLDDLRR